ncbi:tyrosine-type recombinase/integrase [Halobacillus yeomjeoni]|uniref:Tyrosine-type recombinase/integrase n=1 Tax=Halobacillus yeomjeoni TaxID=311194 RepID=A0A931HUP6_9BACI|nr:tyrosine-type recombinase/integrase [Halobacillus yeomjeoni]MBH0229541.1 tyrosine-type recombinase/integrase [Halobacillus yeomjeoni]
MLIKFCIKEFLEDRKFKDLSPYTIKMYSQNLRLFLQHCTKKKIIDVEDVKPKDIKEFLYECRDQGQKISTINNKLRSIKTLMNYLVNEDIIEQNANPTRKQKYIKQHNKVEVLSDYHIKQILNYYERGLKRNSSITNMRTRTMIIFCLSTGVRRGEIINIKWEDIDFDNQVIRVIGKKREVASIPFTNKLKKELAEYKIYMMNRFKNLEYVFPTYSNKKLTDEGVSSIFKQLKRDLNFDDVRVSCHTLRSSFAQRSLMNGMDVLTLQKMMRHESLEMTQIYVNLFGTALADQNNKYNALNNVEI